MNEDVFIQLQKIYTTNVNSNVHNKNIQQMQITMYTAHVKGEQNEHKSAAAKTTIIGSHNL